MITSLNYSSRVDIPEELVPMSIEGSGAIAKLHISWNLNFLKLDPKSEIFAEFSDVRSTKTRRVQLGYLGDGEGECTENISEFRNLKSIRVRFKVVLRDEKNRLRILANIDKVRPKLPPDIENAFSLLNIEGDNSLSVPWTLKFDSGEPILFISKKMKLFDQLRNPTSAPWFFPAVVHEVARQTFLWLCNSEDLPNSNVVKVWQDTFVSLGCDPDFFSNLETGSRSENRREIDAQLGIALDNFARKHGILESMNKYSKLEEN